LGAAMVLNRRAYAFGRGSFCSDGVEKGG
jgi:hypothetical protein